MAGMAQPKVSCLLVTADRKEMCRRSVRCYLRQTYPSKELIILDNGSVDLTDILREIPAEERTYLRVEPADEVYIGGLRNIALEAATGEYVIPQWDDDDWFHPTRIERQVEVLESGYDACSISATLMHLDTGPYFDHPFIGILPNGVPPTIIHRRDSAIRYPDLRRTSDTAYLNSWREREFALLDPSHAYLYIRCFHGSNLWDEDHFVRRIRNTLPDAVAYGWHRFVKRDLFGHPRFQLDERATASFDAYRAESRELGLF
jgi:glycosyltransferase involved in cell wall biosynthesis